MNINATMFLSVRNTTAVLNELSYSNSLLLTLNIA